MYTNKKYTVILSASLEGASYSENLQNAGSLQKYLEYCLYLEIEQAVGHYRGTEELSFVIHTNQLHLVNHLCEYAIKYLKQECVLVSYNLNSIINLVYSEHSETIGARFVPNKGDGENYTRLQGGNNWSVAQ